jgi:hypothetical protein
MKKRSIFVAAALVATVSTAAIAEVIFNADGTGFVGKGDVQLALGLNNKQLQDQADGLAFTATSVSEVTWECLNKGGNVAYKSSETSTQGVVSATVRERNQITGFFLEGWKGNPSVVVDGDVTPGTCPSSQTFIENSIEYGDASGYSLSVNGVELQ